MNKIDFRSSIPDVSRQTYDIFGVKENSADFEDDIDELFSRASLRTPREIKERRKLLLLQHQQKSSGGNSRGNSRSGIGSRGNPGDDSDMINHLYAEDSLSTMTGGIDADSSIYTVNSRGGSPITEIRSSTAGKLSDNTMDHQSATGSFFEIDRSSVDVAEAWRCTSSKKLLK